MEAVEASMSFDTILQLSSSSEWMLDDSHSHQNDLKATTCRLHSPTVTALSHSSPANQSIYMLMRNSVTSISMQWKDVTLHLTQKGVA